MPPRRKQPKMYTDIASWFHLVTAPEDYADEAALYRRLLLEACDRRPKTLLELGSGGGNNASHLKTHFAMTLVDLSPRMLALSRKLNPECEHRRGDMRTVRLRRQFDAVLVHDAVVYMLTEVDLRAAMETAYVHCRPGGAALFVADFTRETFREGTKCGGHDGADGRALRYLEWVTDPDRRDTQYTVDYAYLMRDARGRVRVMHDRHTEGLFSRRDWLRWLRATGFRPHTAGWPDEEFPTPVLVAKKPAK
jgi:trans-aconitate methyltransferase